MLKMVVKGLSAAIRGIRAGIRLLGGGMGGGMMPTPQVADSLLVDSSGELVRTRANIWRDKMLHIARIAREDLRRNFESEGRWYGKPWPALARGTVSDREKMAQKFGLSISGEHPILVRFGSFKQSVVGPVGRDHSVMFSEKNKTIMLISTHRKAKMKEPMINIVERGNSRNKTPPRQITHPKGVSNWAATQILLQVEGVAGHIVKVVGG